MGTWTPAALEEALSGKDEALLRLIRDLTPYVQREAAVVLFQRASSGRDPRQELEDMTQEVLTQLLARDGRRLRWWVPERGLSFGSYVKLVARQQVGMILRSGKRSPWCDVPTQDIELERALPPDPSRPADQTEAKDALQYFMKLLEEHFDERGQILFELLYVDEYDVDEVCRRMSMSRDAVYAWRRRFRQWAAGLETRIEGFDPVEG